MAGVFGVRIEDAEQRLFEAVGNRIKKEIRCLGVGGDLPGGLRGAVEDFPFDEGRI